MSNLKNSKQEQNCQVILNWRELRKFFIKMKNDYVTKQRSCKKHISNESLILAQDERWRRA